MRAKLLADDVVVPCRVSRCAVDDVDEDPRPLDMAQEGMAEAGAAARSLDEAGHVGDRRSPFVVVAEIHDPEVRFERGERVVRDLGRRGGDRGEDRRLARVGQPDEPDVGDQPELQADPALGARLTLLGVLRRLVGRGLEVRVAEPAATAAGDHRALADRDQVRHERAGLVVVDRRAGRHVEDQVVAGPTVPSRLRSAATRRRAEVVPMIEVAQGRLAGIDPKVDRPPATAVAAVGTAARNVRLLAEGRGPVTTIAGADPDLHAVEEHQPHSRTARRPGRRAAGGRAVSGMPAPEPRDADVTAALRIVAPDGAGEGGDRAPKRAQLRLRERGAQVANARPRRPARRRCVRLPTGRRGDSPGVRRPRSGRPRLRSDSAARSRYPIGRPGRPAGRG